MIPDVFTFDVYVVIQSEILNESTKSDKYIGLVSPSLSGFTYSLTIATKYCKQYERFGMTIIPITCEIPTDTILDYLSITYNQLVSNPIGSFHNIDELTINFINYNTEIHSLIASGDLDKFSVTDRLTRSNIHPNTDMECSVIRTDAQETFFGETCSYSGGYLDDIIEHIIPIIHNLMMLSNYVKDRHFQLCLLCIIKYHLVILMILQRSRGFIPSYEGGSDEIHSEKLREVLIRLTEKTHMSYENCELYDFIDVDYFVYFMICINNLHDYDWGQLCDE